MSNSANSANSATYAFEAEGLTKRFGSTQALAGIDLAATPGTVLGVLGPNGAGKTTAVRILATLLRADSGSARVGGYDVVKDAEQVRRTIGLTGQYASVDEDLTGTQNLVMIGQLLDLSARAARARAKELLAWFDLTDAAARPAKTYSGGMRRRLDLAASLVGRPAVIFLDEPTTGLDPAKREDMWDVIRDLVKEGSTVLLTTQYLEEADRLADRVAVLDGGRIVARGTADELKARVGGSRLDLVAADAAAYAGLSTRVGSTAVNRDPAALTIGVPVADDATAVRVLLDELDPSRTDVARFALHRASLDDVFLTLTRSLEPARV